MTNDGFTPVIRHSLADNIRTLEQTEAERQKLQQELYQCRKNKKVRKNKREEVKELERQLEELKEKQTVILPETTQLLEELKNGRRPFIVPDEAEQRYNECVGYAYGTAVCVDDSGMLFFCEIQEDVVLIGETLLASDLHPFADLPDGEQDMILRALLEDEDTPEWFKNRIKAS